MIKDKRKQEEIIGGICSAALLAIIVAWLTSCAEVGFNVALYRKDSVSRSESEQSTATTSPLRCIFNNCLKNSEEKYYEYK